MKKTILTLVLAIGAVFCTSFACTSVIVSGRVSPDGRPYIFKNRDTEGTDNLTMIVNGTRYRFVAIVSAKDSVGRGAWSGHNEAGFAIANTAAYNLNGKTQPKQRQQRDQSKQPPYNDSNIMSKALGCGATLADFEHFLDSLLTLGPIPTNSNFAVLDAQGGCAYYETGNKGYVKYDANDPAQAPYGYLVRTNHGMSGDRDLDKGIER
ncbi:MAG: acyl-CoA--6-aminopenicillanic acid acyl-transferase, partial [Bacteroidales bacterium]|nr:acyl-CoA--6-aminopenicillanic acid acyl-transferase [Bacteroidales bacterium]